MAARKKTRTAKPETTPEEPIFVSAQEFFERWSLEVLPSLLPRVHAALRGYRPSGMRGVPVPIFWRVPSPLWIATIPVAYANDLKKHFPMDGEPAFGVCERDMLAGGLRTIGSVQTAEKVYQMPPRGRTWLVCDDDNLGSWVLAIPLPKGSV